MATYFITGALRGLGLGLSKALLARPESEVKTVITAARKSNQAFQDLKGEYGDRVQFVEMELNEPSIKKAAAEVDRVVGDSGLDVVINNAGVMPWTAGGVAEMDDLMSVLEVNVQGPHLVTKALLPALKRSKRKLVANISSTMGSIAMAEQYMFAHTPAYKISKATLNMLNKQYALYLGEEGLTFVVVSPGWLQTDMGTDGADLPLETGVKAVLEKVDAVSQKDNGKFINIEVNGWTNPSGGPNEYRGGYAPW